MKKKERNINSAFLTKKISEYFGIDKSDIFSKCRRQDMVEARHHLMYYLYYYGENNGSPSWVRDVFLNQGGIGSHASVIHAVKKIDNYISVSVDANRKILEIDAIVGALKKRYVDVYYFMNINKGDVLSLLYNDDSKILWRHDSIERRGNKSYVVGEIRRNEEWVKSDDGIYEYEGHLCYGWDADRLYIDNEPQVL